MEKQNCLGIFISKKAATVVCISSPAKDPKILDCFTVNLDDDHRQDFQVLANLIAKECTERNLTFAESAVALDCALFMQHNVHSEFTDPKQITQTIRFDTEEALAMDITDVAIAFRIISTNDSGSELTVFTARKQILSEILASLQSNNIDPVIVEPDINCLAGFLCLDLTGQQDQPTATLFALFSNDNGYFIIAPSQSKTSTGTGLTMRTLLIGHSQNRAELLTREAPITIALAETSEPTNYIKIADSTDSLDCKTIAETLTINTELIDLPDLINADPKTLTTCPDKIALAIACGAALYHRQFSESINFRTDFLPFQGKKIRLQKTLKFVSISVTVVLLSLGLFLQGQWLQENSLRKLQHEQLKKQYLDVMPGKKIKPRLTLKRQFDSELKRVRNIKSGLLSATGGKTIPAKLALVLKAFNECAAKTNLKINTIDIGAKNVKIVGTTSSRKDTQNLRKALEKNGMKISKDNLQLKEGRDTFSFIIASRKISQGKK